MSAGNVTTAGMTLALVALGACATSSGNAGEVRPEQGIEQLTHPRFSYPTWTPDGTHIVYESAVTGNWEIWMMDIQGLSAGGGKLTRVTSNEHLDRMPSISPDGSSIVFISDRDGDYEVFRMNVDGSRPVQLTFNDLAEIHPYWSPDGRKIIYNRRVAGQRLYEIRMMDPDGSNDVRVLQDEELNSYARISPDGTRVVFDKWQDNDETNGEIYVLTLGTGELRRLTENAVYDGYPAWFPDGERIAYASEVNGSFKLFSMRTDGSDRRQLTFGEGNDARPDVSRDGRRIVFNRESDGNINIHILTLGARTTTATPGAATWRDRSAWHGARESRTRTPRRVRAQRP